MNAAERDQYASKYSKKLPADVIESIIGMHLFVLSIDFFTHSGLEYILGELYLATQRPPTVDGAEQSDLANRTLNKLFGVIYKYGYQEVSPLHFHQPHAHFLVTISLYS
jgi:hypothetical protein